MFYDKLGKEIARDNCQDIEIKLGKTTTPFHYLWAEEFSSFTFFFTTKLFLLCNLSFTYNSSLFSWSYIIFIILISLLQKHLVLVPTNRAVLQFITWHTSFFFTFNEACPTGLEPGSCLRQALQFAMDFIYWTFNMNHWGKIIYSQREN